MTPFTLCLLFGILALSSAHPLVENLPDVDLDKDPAEAETFAGLFEGDIDLMGQNPFDRNAMKDPNKRWPHGIIYYTVSPNYDTAMVQTIEAAMRQIEADTAVNGKQCVQFVQRQGQADYTDIYPRSGCSSTVGRVGGQQHVSLTEGCHRKGTIMHELLHTLGFWHEQSRYDRDNYVTVNWDNIETDHKHNFNTHPAAEMTTLGMPYDYGSIMHYSAREFAKDKNQDTLTPKQSGVTIGQRVQLSPYDVAKIQLLYGCVTAVHGTPTRPPGPVEDKEACTFERDTCEWSQESGDQTDWKRWSGDTPSGRTGPSYDVMNQASGHYMYVEASHHTGEVARMQSSEQPAGLYCLRLFYHMYGSDMGVLKVNALQGLSRHTLHTETGDHGDLWRPLQVDYNAHAPFRFELEGDVGKDYHSDIAVDDVTIHKGPCHDTHVVG